MSISGIDFSKHKKEILESVRQEEEIDLAIVKELEDIKAEFEEDKYILLNQTVAIQIIDRRIAELKGE